MPQNSQNHELFVGQVRLLLKRYRVIARLPRTIIGIPLRLVSGSMFWSCSRTQAKLNPGPAAPRILLLLPTALLLSSCAGYDQWAEETNRKISGAYTEALFGKQSLDIDPSVPKALRINVAYRLWEGQGIPGPASSRFYNKLLGDLTFNRSCRNLLSLNVALFNQNGALIRTEPVMVANYSAGTKALIDKDVMADPSVSRSSQVARLLVKDLRCL